MVCFRKKVVGDGRYFATDGNTGQLCPPLSANQKPERRMEEPVCSPNVVLKSSRGILLYAMAVAYYGLTLGECKP